MSSVRVVTIDTPHGPARAHLTHPRGAQGLLALGHGAGPSITTVDLVATVRAAAYAGYAVALVEQPWLVAGRRVATRPPTLDQAWIPVVTALRAPHGALGELTGPLVVAGRSAGARVACRTAVALDAVAVIALSFPLHPPGKPEATRVDELLAPVRAGLAVDVVQGIGDPFGTPQEVSAAAAHLRAVHPVAGTHTIPAAAADAVAAAVTEALARVAR